MALKQTNLLFSRVWYFDHPHYSPRTCLTYINEEPVGSHYAVRSVVLSYVHMFLEFLSVKNYFQAEPRVLLGVLSGF